ncbi:MAG: hypothetical protein HY906_24765 [Deltaproteobacteria bacterium]|nr:hypothetical protein [Deltaproteobacteria bacterium]
MLSTWLRRSFMVGVRKPFSGCHVSFTTATNWSRSWGSRPALTCSTWADSARATSSRLPSRSAADVGEHEEAVRLREAGPGDAADLDEGVVDEPVLQL